MKRQLPINALLCACLALTFFTNSSVADFYAPAGLSPGDTFHWVFVTSMTRDALSTEIQDYHDFVQAAANASPQVVHGVQGVSALADITWQ